MINNFTSFPPNIQQKARKSLNSFVGIFHLAIFSGFSCRTDSFARLTQFRHGLASEYHFIAFKSATGRPFPQRAFAKSDTVVDHLSAIYSSTKSVESSSASFRSSGTNFRLSAFVTPTK